MSSNSAVLRSALHRAVDAVLVADDALDRHDADALDRAMADLVSNVETARTLAARMREVFHA